MRSFCGEQGGATSGSQHGRSSAAVRLFFFSSRRRHTRWTGDWSSDVCSSDLYHEDSPDKLSEVESVKTEYGAKTNQVDPKTHRVFLTTSDFNPPAAPTEKQPHRSEERRVGKECRSRWWPGEQSRTRVLVRTQE